MVYVKWYYFEIYIRMFCIFHSGDTGSGFLWNIGICVSNYTASYPRHNNNFHHIRISVLKWKKYISFATVVSDLKCCVSVYRPFLWKVSPCF
jgi:hypothetical protein